MCRAFRFPIGDLFSFSGWRSVPASTNWRADQLALGAMLGAGPLGQYTVGDKLSSLPVNEATAPIANMLFPAHARLQDHPERLRHAFLDLRGCLSQQRCRSASGLRELAEPFINIVLGPAWDLAALVVQVLGTVFAASAFQMPVNPAMGFSVGRGLCSSVT